MAIDSFIPELWSSNLLMNLHNTLVFGDPAVFNREYTGEIANFGDTVRINSVGAVTVSDYTKNQGTTILPQLLNDSQMVLTIDQAKYFAFEIDDVDAAQTNPSVLGAAMRESAYALSVTIDTFLSGLIDGGFTAAGTGNWLSDVTSALSTTPGNLYTALVDLSTTLDANNAPQDGRYAIMKPALYGVLLKDTRFTSFGTQANRETISGRAVGNVAGLNIHVSNVVPQTSGHDNIFAGHNMAATFAEQVARVEAYRPQARFSDAIKGLHVYGGKVIRPELLAKVTVAS